MLMLRPGNETDLELIIPINGYCKIFPKLPSRASPSPPDARSTDNLMRFGTNEGLVSLQIASAPVCGENIKVGANGVQTDIRGRVCIYVSMVDDDGLCVGEMR
jgi:hypothetical protein